MIFRETPAPVGITGNVVLIKIPAQIEIAPIRTEPALNGVADR